MIAILLLILPLLGDFMTDSDEYRRQGIAHGREKAKQEIGYPLASDITTNNIRAMGGRIIGTTVEHEDAERIVKVVNDYYGLAPVVFM